MDEHYDVVIIGAGTAGVYFGWQLAAKGHSVLIVEKSPRAEVGKRLEVFHIDSIKFSEFDVPPPKEDSPEFFVRFEEGTFYAPDGKHSKRVKYPFHVMSLPLFLQRMIGLSESRGVRFEFATRFSGLIYENGRIEGVLIQKDDQEREVRARLVVDASGINAAVRTKLPLDYGVENFKTGPNEKFYVVLRYIKWREPDHPKVVYSQSWSYYKTWLAPSVSEDRAIIGVGATASFDHAEEVLKDCFDTIDLPPYEIEKFERGVTPFRRPPYSLVGDGFLCLGDAACLTKPFSGEGVTSAWTLCKIAADVVDRVLKGDKTISADTLWDINVRYFGTQGAKFAGILATVPSAINTSKMENQFLFDKNIIFSEEDFTDMNRDFEMHLSTGKIVRIISTLMLGVLTGNYSLSSLGAMLKSVTISGTIRKHYENFPRERSEFRSWVAKADGLWKKANAKMK